MADDRTPFELASKMGGQDLIDYRAVKVKLGFKDPKFYVCPECEIVALGDLDPRMGTCEVCHQAKEDAKRKAWKQAEDKKVAAKTPAGNLADKVREFNERRKDQETQKDERVGAERAYPND